MRELFAYALKVLWSFKDMLYPSSSPLVQKPKNTTISHLTWKILNTLPQPKFLAELLQKIVAIEEKIIQQSSTNQQKTTIRIYGFQKELLNVLKLIYYYPVIGKNEHDLQVYSRHILKTLLDECKNNISFYGKNHTLRVMEAYNSLLTLKSNIIGFLNAIDQNKFLANKLQLTSQEIATLHELLSYVQLHLTVFNKVFDIIYNMHQDNKSRMVYNSGNHNDMGILLDKFFVELDEIKRKQSIANTNTNTITASATSSSASSTTTPIKSPTVKHNSTPKDTPNEETPQTKKSGLFLNTCTEALKGGGNYSPNSTGARKKLFVAPQI